MKSLFKTKVFPPIQKLYICVVGILGCILVMPIRVLFPRKKHQIILLGVCGGFFVDNIKYFFLHLQNATHNLTHYFITSNSDVYNNLRKHFGNIIYYPSIKAIWIMLRSNIVVMDNAVLDEKFRFVFVKGAKKIQLWHGIGFKKFWGNTSLCTKLLTPYFYFIGTKSYCDSFISTSQFFTENYFRLAFKSRKFIETNYPRNDFLWHNNHTNNQIYLETDQDCLTQIKKFKQKKTRILIYAPTFRGVRGRGNNSMMLDLPKLNKFAIKNRIVFILKLHPILYNNALSQSFERIIYHRSDKDVYPILPLCDAMITDYSSIFMDYLILNRPVLFYMHDKQDYETNKRMLTFFYKDFIVGDISFTQDELQHDILHVLNLNSGEKWAVKRSKILDIAYKYKDGRASERILDHMVAEYCRKP